LKATEDLKLMEVNMISIKRAEKSDAAEITKIKIAAFNKEINTYLGRDGGPSGYNKVESELGIIENHLAYKILLDERIIGGFFLYYEGGDILHFEDFVINPEYQGNGYGYETLCMVQKMYPEVREWKLSTPVFSVGNQHLYEKFGYVEVSRNNDEVFYSKVIS
jgi:GNAT superfamily N-acetyltransferase